MGDFFGDYDRAGVHRLARKDPSRRGQLHRVGPGTFAQLLHYTRRWNSSGPYEADFCVSAACAGSVICRRAIGRGGRQRAAVARVGGVLSPARARGNGDGRCEDDADGRRVSWPKTHIADNFRWLRARKHPGNYRNRGAAQGFRLRTAVWHLSRDGRSTGGIFWNADCILVSGTAGGALMARAHLADSRRKWFPNTPPKQGLSTSLSQI